MKTKTALILTNIGVLPLMTAFGGLNGDLLQYYASGYFALSETEIGLAIGLLGFTIPLQILSTQFVPRWGTRRVLLAGFGLRFTLMPLLLLVPGLLTEHRPVGLLLFYALVFLVHLVHVCTFGVAWQPLVRRATVPEERGEFFGRMRFVFNGFNFAFFATMGATVGQAISAIEFLFIILFLMIYCLFAFVMIWRMDEPSSRPLIRASWRQLVSNAGELLHHPTYRALVVISFLRLPSSLPLFVVYLTLVVGLSASAISWIVAFRAIGMMTGFVVWGRVIRLWGYSKAVFWPLVVLVAVGNLWFLFAMFDRPNAIQEATVAIFSLIALLTAFAHSGFGLGIVTGVHNTARDDNAVVVLTLFDIVDMGLESMMAALAGAYIYAFFSGNGSIGAHSVLFDPYMLLCLVGAALAGVAAITALRYLTREASRA